ncbi:MAG: hypothetical protein KFB96_13360 [Thiocapsa sp.]|uniref:hypothetical protein n=1 Tax=Thiocapsa sp. TaxID=2024551 RepID=UPI001BCAF8F1|nr:hypothetical protein [Thiocapsa sp.]QVL46753.1 MAG: hypothetical protein KFB96_13360 [Thiocapsa sp.]
MLVQHSCVGPARLYRVTETLDADVRISNGLATPEIREALARHLNEMLQRLSTTNTTITEVSR